MIPQTPLAGNEEQSNIDYISKRFDTDDILPDHEQWQAKYATTLNKKIIPTHDTDAVTMPISFAYFLSKDIRPYIISHCLDRSAKYMNEANLPKNTETLD